jgi:type II secretory pathway component PulF
MIDRPAEHPAEPSDAPRADATFRYRAATADGRVLVGTVAGPSREAALAELNARRLAVISLEADAPPAATGVPRRRARVPLPLWTRTLATLLGAGVRLDEGLSFLVTSAAGSPMEGVTRAVREAVRGGASLAAALRAHPGTFDAVYVAMVDAGEAGGALPLVLEQLADHLEERAELRAQLRGALAYPALLAATSIVGVGLLLVVVLPRFAAMLGDSGGTLPLSTRALLAVGGAVTGWWWLWLTVLAGVMFWAARERSHPARRQRWAARRLGWPLVGEVERAWGTARLTRTLGILVGSGVAVLPAIRIARTAVANPALGAAVDEAERRVAEGQGIAASLGDAVTPLAARLLAAGEESGRLAQTCLRVAESHEREVRRALHGAVSVVSPALVLLFAAVVGFVALALLQAIYSVNARAF